MKEAKNTFIGAVVAPNENSVGIGVIDVSRQHVVARTFTLTRTPFPDYFSAKGAYLTDDMIQVDQFLASNIVDPERVRALVEVDETYGYPESDPQLVGIVQIDSVSLKVLAVLNHRKSISFKFLMDNKQPPQRVLLEPIPDIPQLEESRAYQALYVRRHLSKAYADILLGRDSALGQASIAAALVAKNKGAYRYWSSFGSVQSSGDIVAYLGQQRRNREEGFARCDKDDRLAMDPAALSVLTGLQGYEAPTSVISDSEAYTTYTSAETRFEELDKIPLRYAVTAKKYEHLGPNDRIKASLLQVCKSWNITLTCRSLFRKALDPVFTGDNNHELVYPIAVSDYWILDAVEREGFSGHHL